MRPHWSILTLFHSFLIPSSSFLTRPHCPQSCRHQHFSPPVTCFHAAASFLSSLQSTQCAQIPVRRGVISVGSAGLAWVKTNPRAHNVARNELLLVGMFSRCCWGLPRGARSTCHAVKDRRMPIAKIEVIQVLPLGFRDQLQMGIPHSLQLKQMNPTTLGVRILSAA